MSSAFAVRFPSIGRASMAVPAGEPGPSPAPVFWAYADQEGRWRVRKEGGATEATFGSRAAAVAFLRDLVKSLSSYRLFLEQADGRIVQEAAELPPMSFAAEESSSALTVPVSNDVPAAATDRHEGPAVASKSGLRRRLEWADRLSSEARQSPSRSRLLAEWIRGTR
jgi:hypothetical protein